MSAHISLVLQQGHAGSQIFHRMVVQSEAPFPFQLCRGVETEMENWSGQIIEIIIVDQKMYKK